ncbi:hypothetical protein EYF80_018556 [Liparis tanakae]|uniref:Uncharacterized protein n=1 Tax=Liparis tanakae TaxID=230148 RepID=A0A4Z2HZV7_9TELE|nr:hypothetical protein EYF80_018556 [Liparis tanakae]
MSEPSTELRVDALAVLDLGGLGASTDANERPGRRVQESIRESPLSRDMGVDVHLPRLLHVPRLADPLDEHRRRRVGLLCSPGGDGPGDA